jgi:DNA helicase MCM8
MDESRRSQVLEIWPRYFPLDKPGPFTGSTKDIRVSIIETFYSVFLKDDRIPSPDCDWAHRPDSLVYLDVQELAAAVPIPDFVTALRSKPREIIGCIGIALSLVARLRYSTTPETQATASVVKWSLRPRFTNLGEDIPYELLKSSCVGQLVSFRGHVVRVSPPRPLVIGGWFLCGKCGDDTWQAFEDGVFCVPSICGAPSCRSKTLELRRDRVDTEEYQTIRIQVRVRKD